MEKGLFITVEGTDGSGKTTQLNLMKEYLTEKGFEVLVTREPGGNKISEKIRDIILDTENSNMCETTEMLLYASARAQLVYEVIVPALESGKIVLCDRFLDSSYVYQGFGRGINLVTIADINRIALNGIVPDVTFFFDISPEMALKRRIKATGADRIEKEEMDFHMKVYDGYRKLSILYSERIRSIESNRSIEAIFNDVKAYLNEFLY